MQPLIFTAFTAITLSAIAIFWSVWSSRKIELRIRAHENLKLTMAVELKLVDLPSALRFHGIELSEIEAAGLTTPEFIYLVQSFSAGQAYYEFESISSSSVFVGDEYRARMCAQSDVRAAWKYIRIFLDATSYRDKLDRTFASQTPHLSQSAAE